jgi:hypothetical protein
MTGEGPGVAAKSPCGMLIESEAPAVGKALPDTPWSHQEAVLPVWVDGVVDPVGETRGTLLSIWTTTVCIGQSTYYYNLYSKDMGPGTGWH